MLLIKTINKCCLEFLFKIYFYTWCVIILVSVSREVHVYCMIDNSTDAALYSSGLCFNDSKSCSHQMRDGNLSNEACNMTFHEKLSSVCRSENILDGEVDPNESYGKLILETYIFRHQNHNSGPAINISFSEINWKKIYMRFIENQVKTPSLCREFEVTPEISSSFTLYFDCLWSTAIEQKAYHFEYQAFTPSGDSFTYKYLFQVPIGDNIDVKTNLSNWTIFMVVDMTNMPEHLVLRLQVAPKRLGVKGYKVEVLKKLKDNSWVVKTVKLYAKPGEKEIRFLYETKSKFGNYVFEATLIHENCTERTPCAISSSPHILIVEMAEPKFLTTVVSVVILIPILLMGYLIWRRKWDPEKDQTREPTGPPKLLLMYSPVSVKHVQTMIEMAKYFNKTCGLVALIDELGIPESVTKDPLRWYINSFNEADYVAIFASPDSVPTDREAVRKFSRYQHIEAIAQNQLSHRLISTETKCKFFSISIPKTNWDNLPPEAAALKRYTLPRDLDPLLVLIGVSPQCDGGYGFNQALEAAAVTVRGLESIPPPIHSPPALPIAEEEEGADGRASPCCNTLSVSDLELVSSRQYLSDTDTASSIDHLSLLGDS